jgi:hypothetical protein
MGIVLAARKSRDHDTARRALHPPNLIFAAKEERQRIAAYIPRWGIQLAAHLSESTAWAIYRDRLKRFGSLIGDREPIVLHKEMPGMGRAKRYIITIADDDRAPLDKLCQKLIAADATCDVLRTVLERSDQGDIRNNLANPPAIVNGAARPAWPGARGSYYEPTFTWCRMLEDGAHQE